jgi:diaminopimelate epimerase
MRFLKLHGAGNDFILVDARSSPELITPAKARFLCDRNFGIGADGVLALLEGHRGRPRMKIYNSDGSVPEMCGNGLRCFVKALADHFGFGENPLTVETEAGGKTCRHRREGDVTWVDVEMGEIRNAAKDAALAMQPAPKTLVVEGLEIQLTAVSTGNPHAVTFQAIDEPTIRSLAPRLTRHPSFPEGSNVEFVTRLSDRELRVIVHERGAGFTLACGTGAVASTAVAVALGLCPARTPIRVNLPGGTLYVSIASDFRSSTLSGPAVEVFQGTIEF